MQAPSILFFFQRRATFDLTQRPGPPFSLVFWSKNNQNESFLSDPARTNPQRGPGKLPDQGTGHFYLTMQWYG